MSKTEALEELLALPLNERRAVVDVLSQSLEPAQEHTAVPLDEELASYLDRLLDDERAGRVAYVPLQDAMLKLHGALKQARKASDPTNA